ncbi:hypothetical protein B0T17DRAFT_481182 [Bombardia bombarda]|uniref:BAR domain-containing protein n=1 Tax=Bombardia bombarda TaxID=252184 RepID=A0AA39XN35_9PEZI|nr:hypothetical protein B0T17DRAFT_481182 [Bombardia bombarda]
MNITKKLDRAFQWAGEKMGAEAKTTMSEDFKQLETEMALRFDGMDRMQKSMNLYVKWLGRRAEVAEDKEKGLPVSYLGRSMISHGEEFDPDSEFGNCLIAMGRANERVAAIQETFVAEATATWLESLERSLAMMKEYQSSRKKLEGRRLAYDASMTKMQKGRRDDFRVEEELRAAKAKYEEASEDVLRRMQDIRDAETDSVRDMTQFLDAELDYHERCADELRRARKSWAGTAAVPVGGGGGGGGSMSGYGGGILERRPTGRSRSNTAQSYTSRTSSRNRIYEAEEVESESTAPPVRMPIRSGTSSRVALSVQPQNQQQQQHYDTAPAVRPLIGRASTFQGGASLDRERIGGGGRITSGASNNNNNSNNNNYAVNQNIPHVGSLRGQLRPVSRIVTNSRDRDDVFGHRDDDDTNSDSGTSPDWANRSTSPATSSAGSLSRTTSNVNVAVNGGGSSNGYAARKAPPPPPPSRSKKPPPPPVPARRGEVGY